MSGEIVNFYAVLGVATDVSQDEIWAAYHRLKESALRSGGDAHSRLLDQAVAVLGNEESRYTYDRGLQTSSREQGGRAPSQEGTGNRDDRWDMDDGSVIGGSSRTEVQEQPRDRNAFIRAGMGPRTVEFDQSPASEQAETTYAFRMSANASSQEYSQPYGLHDRNRQPQPQYLNDSDDDYMSGVQYFLNKTTLAVGALFAILISIAWMLELPVMASMQQPPADTEIKMFLAKASQGSSFIGLWVVSFVVAFLLWGCQIFGTHLMAEMAERRFDAGKRGVFLTGLILLMLLTLLPAIPKEMDSTESVKEIALAALRQFLLFLPLFFCVSSVGGNAYVGLIWAAGLLLGHLLFVAVACLITGTPVSLEAYFTRGLFMYGYLVWWLGFYAGLKGLKRLL